MYHFPQGPAKNISTRNHLDFIFFRVFGFYCFFLLAKQQMGTAVLRSQDCLRGRFHPEIATYSPLLKSRPNPSPNGTRSRRRRRSPMGFQDNVNDRVSDRERPMVVKSLARNLVMGQVTILKRGEALSPPKNLGLGDDQKGRVKRDADVDSVLGSTDRLGPEPEMVQKAIRVSESKVVDGLYAGSAFFSSPPPSSLPLPLFFRKKDGSPSNDVATSDLRRLLRLDFL